MLERDIPDFTALLDSVCSLLSRGTYQPSDVNTALWFRALAKYDLKTVRAGFDAHVRDPQRGRFVPNPADIVAQIEGIAAEDGRPGPDEAWATANQARSEDATVVWTAETMAAWSICKSLIDSGDAVAARMAFKEAYTRLVEEARTLRMPASWQTSLGHDTGLRDIAIRAAVEDGRLNRSELLAIGAPAVPLLSLAESKSIPQEARDALLRLRDKLVANQSADSHDLAAKQVTATAKWITDQAVQGYLKGGGA
jgi:hypothetical protein